MLPHARLSRAPIAEILKLKDNQDKIAPGEVLWSAMHSVAIRLRWFLRQCTLKIVH